MPPSSSVTVTQVGDVKLISMKPPVIVRDFATALGMRPFQLISELMQMGIFAAITQSLDEAVAAKMVECARSLPPGVSEVPRAGFTLAPSERVRVPRLVEAHLAAEHVAVALRMVRRRVSKLQALRAEPGNVIDDPAYAGPKTSKAPPAVAEHMARLVELALNADDLALNALMASFAEQGWTSDAILSLLIEPAARAPWPCAGTPAVAPALRTSGFEPFSRTGSAASHCLICGKIRSRRE